MKINISIHETVLQQLEAYADKHAMSKSAVIAKALGVLFARDEASDTLKRAAQLADEIEEAKLITEDAARRYKRILSEIEAINKSAF